MKILLQRHDVVGPVRESSPVWHLGALSFEGFLRKDDLMRRGSYIKR